MEMEGASMRVLVYGAGVIGGFLAHVLCQAGNEVSLLARGAWRETLERDGLVIRHSLQRKTTVDHPRVIGGLDGGEYDAVFAVMQHQQLWTVLEDLAAVKAPTVVLVGNNMSAGEMEARILEKSEGPKTVLFGFQGTGGRREDGKIVCVRFGEGSMTLGGVHGQAAREVQERIAALFAGTKYRLTWMPDMDGWYKSHLALILPAAYLCYATGCDLRRASRSQRRQLMAAAREGYQLLQAQGCPILPPGEDAYYRPGPKYLVMAGMVLLMAKTVVGDLAASDHCRHAVSEMEGLDRAWRDMRGQGPEVPMPNWDGLRRAMPQWEELHETYQA